jgi:hypothetical protein
MKLSCSSPTPVAVGANDKAAATVDIAATHVAAVTVPVSAPMNRFCLRARKAQVLHERRQSWRGSNRSFRWGRDSKARNHEGSSGGQFVERHEHLLRLLEKPTECKLGSTICHQSLPTVARFPRRNRARLLDCSVSG